MLSIPVTHLIAYLLLHLGENRLHTDSAISKPIRYEWEPNSPIRFAFNV